MYGKKNKGIMQNPADCRSSSKSVTDPFENEFMNTDFATNITPSKKRKKFAVVAALLAVILFMTTLSTAIFSTSVKAAVYGPKYYYLSIERQNMKDLFKNFKQNYIENNLAEYSFDLAANAKMTGDLISTDESLKSAADFLSNLDINARYNANLKDIDNQYYTASFAAKLKGSSLGGIDIKTADNKALISFPDLSEKNLGVKVSDEYNKYFKAFLDDDKAFEEVFGISREAFRKLNEKYLKDVIFNAIPNEKVRFNRNAVFQDNKCNSIVFNIDSKVISRIYTALAKEVAKDKELKTILQANEKSFNTYIEGLGDEYTDLAEISDIDQDIKDMSNSLNEAAKEIEDINMTYTVYFKNDGDILSRSLENREAKESLNLASYTDKSGNDILTLYYERDGKKIIDFNNEQKLDNGIYKGKFGFGISGGQILSGEYTREKDARVGGREAYVGELKGSFKVQKLDSILKGYMLDFTSIDDMDSSDSLYEDDEYDYYDSDESLSDVIGDINFSYNSKKQGSDTLLGEAMVSTKIDGKSFNVSVNTSLKQSDKANIAKPAVSLDKSIDMTDIDEMQDLGEDIGQKLMLKILKVMPEFLD